MEFLTVILTSSAVSTVVSGLFSTFAAPYINWGIEKKKMQQENRKELLKAAREEINSESFRLRDFEKREIYSRIKPYLSETTKEKIKQSHTVAMGVTGGSIEDMFRKLISEDLHKQEERWHLV